MCLKTDSILCFLLIAFVQYEADKLLEKESYANPGISPWRNTPRYKIHEICMGYLSSMQSRWLPIGQALFFFACLWTETESRSINTQRKEQGQYPAILTEQAWSIKDIVYGKKMLFSRGTQWVTKHHVSHSGSQPQDRIWFKLPTHTASHLTKMWGGSVAEWLEHRIWNP